MSFILLADIFKELKIDINFYQKSMLNFLAQLVKQDKLTNNYYKLIINF